MKFLGNTKNRITKDWIGENIPHLEYFIFLKAFNSEFLHIKIWFTNQNSTLLQIEEKINITLLIKV